ncbi:MAG: ACT domain-containing protein [Candidatus Micrarchaeota archaeon]
MIKGIVIISKDKIGLLADISYIFAKEKINIEQIDANLVDNTAIIMLGVESTKYKKAKAALIRNKYHILAEKSFVVKLEDTPGSFSKLTKKLADAKINILNVHVIGKEGKYVYDSITVNKPKDAKDILRDELVEELIEEAE